jgi:hypothetical protein
MKRTAAHLQRRVRHLPGFGKIFGNNKRCVVLFSDK